MGACRIFMEAILSPDGISVKYAFRMEARDWDHRPFTNWIEGQLRRRDWKPADLAHALGMPSGTVSRWLDGSRQPESTSCERIADVLFAEPDDVLLLAGRRPGPVVIPPDDPKADIIRMVQRMKMTADREDALRGALERYLKADARARIRAPGR